jgi:hypothetical protein
MIFAILMCLGRKLPSERSISEGRAARTARTVAAAEAETAAQLSVLSYRS